MSRRHILVIDNFDSFTFNLIHLIEQLDERFTVVRNNELESLNLDEYSHLLIGPGPGLPSESGKLIKTLNAWPTGKPLFGVCLGLQAMVEKEGGRLENMSEVQHGAQSLIDLDNTTWLFQGIPKSVQVGRYHSWCVFSDQLPPSYTATSVDAQGVVMAIQHISRPWCAVQFHPESIMTEYGLEMLRNWVNPDQRKNQ